MKKYKYTRKQICTNTTSGKYSNGYGLIDKSIRKDLLALADKPKKECKHKELEQINPDGKMCEKCFQYLPCPTPSKIKSEIEKLPELSSDNPIHEIVVVDKINELVERINFLSTKDKKVKS